MSSNTPELIAELEAAMAAVQVAEDAVTRVLAESRIALTNAATVRNATIRQAEVDLKAAQAVYDGIVAKAQAEHDAIVVRMREAVDQAKAAYAEASTKAEPLLRQLHEKAERIASAAQPGRR